MSSRHRGPSAHDWGASRPELPDYYAILRVPTDADAETLRAAYHQLARQYHPDVAGDEGIVRMKEINRAYSILSDPDKRRAYDTARAGILDLRPHARQRAGVDGGHAGGSLLQDRGLLYTGGPLRPGRHVETGLGSIAALAFAADGGALAIAALAPEVALWQPVAHRAAALRRLPAPPLRDGRPAAIRRLRVGAGGVVVGWGQAQLTVWGSDGAVRLAYPLGQPRLAAPEVADARLAVGADGLMALPQALTKPMIPWDLGARGTDVLPLLPATASGSVRQLRCSERPPAERRYWAIRLRALAADAPMLLTCSCVRVAPNEPEIVLLRHWDLAARSWLNKPRPRVMREVEAGRCAEIGPPYVVTPDANLLACAVAPDQVRVYDIAAGTFDQVPAGPLGAFAHLALADDGSALAVAREDSESAEGVVEVWSVRERALLQRLVHPSRVGALAFAPDRRALAVGLANGEVQLWTLA
jgi:hypothetical protein